MDVLSENEESELLVLMAREFLESRLGVDITPENIYLFVIHIVQFEQEIRCLQVKKASSNVIYLESVKNFRLN